MNKVNYLILFLFLQSLCCFAQSVTGQLENAHTYRTEDGFIAYGFSGSKSALEFHVIKYDNNLQQLASYKKQIEGKVQKEMVYLFVSAENEYSFLFLNLLTTSGILIRLSPDLKELLYHPYDKEEVKAIPTSEFSPDGNKRTLNLAKNFANYDPVGMLWDGYKVNGLQQQIQKSKSQETVSISRFIPVKNKTWPEYELKWNKKTPHAVCQSYNYLLVKDKVLIFVNDLTEETFGQDLYCLNPETGEEQFAAKLNDFDKDNVLIPGKAIFDPKRQEFVIVGNYYTPEPKKKHKYPEEMNGYFFLKLNASGAVIKYRKVKFPETVYKKKKDKLFISIQDLMQKEDGKYIINGEYRNYAEYSSSQSPSGEMSYKASSTNKWIPFAFSILQVNENLETVDSLFCNYESSALKSITLDLQPMAEPDLIFSFINNSFPLLIHSDFIFEPKEEISVYLYGTAQSRKYNYLDANGLFYIVKIEKGKITLHKNLNEYTNKQLVFFYIKDTSSLYKFTYTISSGSYQLEIIPIQ